MQALWINPLQEKSFLEKLFFKMSLKGLISFGHQNIDR